MIESGHIEIKDDKVIFVYHKLPIEWLQKQTSDKWNRTQKEGIKAIKKYEASKRSVEVSNVTKKLKKWYYDIIGIDY
ncbi:unnamed protein product, partial [marine sediment metagenome]